MKKGWIVLAILAVSSAVCAQNETSFGREDLLAVFQKYNPAVLEKAAQDEQYAAVLQQLLAAYQGPRTQSEQYEMIALAKNFDNSLALHIIGQNYLEQWTLQQMSGQALPSWKEDMTAALTPAMQAALDNTLFVRKLQIKDYKEQLKQLRRNAELTAEQKKEQQAQIKEQIRQVKQEMQALKADRNKTVRSAVEDYTEQLRSDYLVAQALELKAQQSDSHDVKANHKKPVAK